MGDNIKINNRSKGKYRVGFLIGIKQDEKVPVLHVLGNSDYEDIVELTMTTIMTAAESMAKRGASKEKLYNHLVEIFSLTVDRFYPQGKGFTTPEEVLEAFKKESKFVSEQANKIRKTQ